MRTGIIFDMDGTLWDSSANVAASWTEKLRMLGEDLTVTRDDIMSVMGLTMDRIADMIFARFPENRRAVLLEECCVYENDYLRKHGGVLYPDLEKTLARLRERYRLFIVSNCQSGYIEAFLDFYGFGGYFDDIECYGNNLKDKGSNIALISERNELEKAYYVGDIQGDCDAAEKAGKSFIHAAYGYGTIDHEVPRIEKFSDLPELMMKLEELH